MSVALAHKIAPAAARPLRVMIVDDAVVVRGLLARWIESEPDFELAAVARTGREAVDRIERANPDVVVLDVTMPEMDGVSALPLLLKKKRDVVVIMASTLTRKNAEISLRALSLGAADYVTKPSSNRETITSNDFRRELIDKIRQLGARALSRKAGREERVRARVAEVRAQLVQPPPAIKLRPFSLALPRVVVIGSSTGGPQALMTMIGELGPVIERSPILITQHMPPTFTTILAEHLARIARVDAHEAVDGEPVRSRTIYLAPGAKHMSVVRIDGTALIKVDDGEPINFCKPAVDPLFTSAASVWGCHVLGVVLTGMGSDGTAGAKDIAAAGGSVIAQDEATSVVWGMPAQAAASGACSAVLPLPEIAPRITRLFAGTRT